MAKSRQKETRGNTDAPSIDVSERQIEIFARRLLPEIKRCFADEAIRQEFEQWQKKLMQEYTK